MKAPLIALLASCAALAACNRAEAPSTSSDSPTGASAPATGTDSASPASQPDSTLPDATSPSTTPNSPSPGLPPPVDDQRPTDPGAAGGARP